MIGIVNTLWRVYTPTLAIFLGVILVMVALSRKELYRKQLRYSITKRSWTARSLLGSFLVCDRWVLSTHQVISIIIVCQRSFYFRRKSIWLSGFLGLLLAACVLLLISNYLCSGKDIFANAGFDKNGCVR